MRVLLGLALLTACTDEVLVTPVIDVGQKFAVDGGSRNILGAVDATDADDTNQAGFTKFKGWQVRGGTGANLFAIGSSDGVLRVKNALAVNLTKTSYTLVLKTTDGANASADQTVTITIPSRIKTCLYGIDVQSPKLVAKLVLALGGTFGTCRAP